MRARAALEIKEIFCKMTGITAATASYNFDNDGTAVNGALVACPIGGYAETTLTGAVNVGLHKLIDVKLGTVTGDVAAVSVCFEYTYD